MLAMFRILVLEQLAPQPIWEIWLHIFTNSCYQHLPLVPTFDQMYENSLVMKLRSPGQDSNSGPLTKRVHCQVFFRTSGHVTKVAEGHPDKFQLVAAAAAARKPSLASSHHFNSASE